MEIEAVTKLLIEAVRQYIELGCADEIKTTVPIYAYIKSPKSWTMCKQHVLDKLEISAEDFIMSPYYTIGAVIRLNKKLIPNLYSIDVEVLKPVA